MKRINPLDASWLYVESHETPMHVGNLQTFSLPRNAPDDYLQQLARDLKHAHDLAPPWNLKLASPRLRALFPAWITDHDVDLDYHVRHSALPRPGGERELGMLISRLHSRPLDFSRPPWESTLIEGLEGNRFALYTKMHHSLIDGVGGMRLMQRLMSTDPDERGMRAFWMVRQEKTRSEVGVADAARVAGEAFGEVRRQASSVPDLLRALQRLTRAARSHDDPLTAPFTAPRSVLNGRVKNPRRFATQQYALAGLKALAKTADCTLNDVVLYLCSTALRRFMQEGNVLPRKPLTAGIPVNVRSTHDESTGTSISFMIASLATDVADPRRRLEAITASTRAAKEHLQKLPKHALMQYTMLVMAPYILQLMTGLGGRVRPVFNVTISNVPGPEQPLYFNGARLEAMFPVSLIAHGGALNITCLSYAGTLNFGFTGCRDTLPHMQRLAVYTGEALDELRALMAPVRKKRATT